MLENTQAFSSFSVDDIPKAKQFYKELLGLRVEEEDMQGMPLLKIFLGDEHYVLVYPKESHTPATFTVLNFGVSDLAQEVKDLKAKGIKFEKYEGTDKDGIQHEGNHEVAWFKDPAGNFISVMNSSEAVQEDVFSVKKFIPADVSEVFKYLTTASLLEQWCVPDGMTLEIPLFEAKEDGNYRFEHSDKNGVYVCTGYFKEFIPNKRLVQIDESVQGPDGKVMYQNLKLVVDLKEKSRGTEVTFTQSGFDDDQGIQDCQKGVTQSLETLSRLMAAESSRPESPGRLSV